MPTPPSKEIYILGLTLAGRAFRPSDWAERLAGVMSQFRPGAGQPGRHLGYSPWCVPSAIEGVNCVILHPELRDHEVMAWDFCINFARDNGLQVVEKGPPS
jgi:hypothetical protein